MSRIEKDKLIADWIGIHILSKIEYIQLTACPPHEVDNMPDYYPTFYNWNRIMPIAAGLINGYYESHDLDDLMTAGGRFDLQEIYEEVVRVIKEINNDA